MFSDYEKHHLHYYVDKKGTSYTKQELSDKLYTKVEVDNKLAQAKTEIMQTIIQFRNEQVKKRVGKKTLQIPKTNRTEITLLTANELGLVSLDDIIILTVWIKRYNHFFHLKSSHVANAFSNLEFFIKRNQEYICYFDNHPSNWNMSCVIDYVVKPKEII